MCTRGQGGAEEHRRFFGLAPNFDAPISSILFERAFAHAPVFNADAGLAVVLDRHVEALLKALPAPTESTSYSVRRALAELMQSGEPSLAAVAARLRRSERTLQRHLSEEGTTFDRILDDLRRELSLRYLASSDVAIAEVAWLLGYSEASAFHRSFKRWMKKTPAEYRASLH